MRELDCINFRLVHNTYLCQTSSSQKEWAMYHEDDISLVGVPPYFDLKHVCALCGIAPQCITEGILHVSYS